MRSTNFTGEATDQNLWRGRFIGFDCLPPQYNNNVWFYVDDDKGVAQIIDINLNVHDLKPGSVILLPRINAINLERAGIGRILSPNEVVEKVFLPRRAQGEKGENHSHLDRRKAGHLEYCNTSDPPHSGIENPIVGSTNHQNNQPRIHHLIDLNDLMAEELIYCENYSSIEPAPKLVELAEQLGYEKADFFGFIHRFDAYRCEGCNRLIVRPYVDGGRLNPFKLQSGSRRSAKALALKLAQLNAEAKVLERDHRTGVLRLLRNNNLYLLPLELTYPHELNAHFLKLLKEDKDKFYRLREKAISTFFKKLLRAEFGEYATFSEFIYWFNHHDWSSKSPDSPHFHEHINLLNVVYDWRGSSEFRVLREVLSSYLTPTKSLISRSTGWSLSKTKRLLGFFRSIGLIENARGSQDSFFTTKYFDIASPLIRFNPLRFNTEKLDLFRSLWKATIEEIFGVKLKEQPVVHLPDKLISLDLSNVREVIHRLAYCSRKPVTDVNNFLLLNPVDIDLDWLAHLLSFNSRIKGSRITRKFSTFTGVEFLATLEGRYYRLRAKLLDLIEKLNILKVKEKDLLLSISLTAKNSLQDFDSLAYYEKELEKLRYKITKIESELDELNDIVSRIEQLKRIYHVDFVCPICGGKLHIVQESVDSLPVLFFDPHSKRWALLWENG